MTTELHESTNSLPKAPRFQTLLRFILAAGLILSAARARADSLDAGFINPPASAKPHTWWHWMNGNITREGITADLEAMQRVGIGGAQIFNADCGILHGPVQVLSPEWLELVRHAASEADRLGLELCIHNCAGWSSSGGPWNTTEHAMQRVTTSEKKVKGPAHFSAVLAQPPTKLDYYRDVAVLAFPTPESEKDVKKPRPAIDDIEAKNGSNGKFVMSSPARKTASGLAIPRSTIVDLTSHLQADGRLEWDVPPGKWTILRLGHTPTGRDNHPAPHEATGPECDKFSKEALDAHWAGYVQKVLDKLGPLAGPGKAFNDVLIDSYEVGGQNWTPKFRAEFQKRRGYDLWPYLPVFTGRIVDSSEVSERFLWDVRRTIADLFAENYYGHFQELCHQHGLKASFEPYTGPFESLQCGAMADIPMGEFWVGNKPHSSVKLAASVGHINGQPVIGAESFTGAPAPTHGRWLDDPYSLKTLGDRIFCLGVNRYIFHRYAMQPWTNRWPGMTMGQWGTHFDRTVTWWEQGRAWLQYVARCQFMLQQGRFVADAAYFSGLSTPAEMRAGDPPLPEGYDYDGLDAAALLRASVQDGALTLPSGMSYRLLVLPPSDRALTPPLLRKISGLVADGLTLVGAPPLASPSLEDYPRCDAEVKELVGQMWGNCDGKKVTEHAFGKGKVIWGQPLAQVLAGLSVQPDFQYTNSDGAQLVFIHRHDSDADMYFVSNQRKAFDTVECTFRVNGKAPELWNPETGRIDPAPVWREQEGRTAVQLSFDPAGSVFVVFRAKPQGDHLIAVRADQNKQPASLTAKPAKLRILKAIYGDNGKHSAWVDVTDSVKTLVAAGTRFITANNKLAGNDPAPMTVKQLRLEFRLNGRSQTTEVQEGQKAELPPGAQLVKASYGILSAKKSSGAQSVNLTRKLSRLVKQDQLDVRVDDTLIGRDLLPGTPKQLRIDYSVNGVRKHATVQENEMLTLPEAIFSGEPPSYTFTTGSDAQPQLMAWIPGKFNLDWASGRQTEAQCQALPAPVELAGPWEVRFPPGWKAPAKVTFKKLISWPESSDPGVKYFSGTATYEKEFEVPAHLLGANCELWLDLGVVKNLAEVTLNGEPLGILWKPPFRVNVSMAAKPGTNRLQVKVTNLWPNRLIGDEQLPPDCEWNGKPLKAWPHWLEEGKPSPTGRVTFTTWRHWTKDDALLDSGLLGPVVLRVAEEVKP